MPFMTLREFREYAENAFAPVARAYGMRALPPDPDRLIDPYYVCFANETTFIEIEGRNYGRGIAIWLGSTKATARYHLGDLLEIRAPEFQPPRAGDTEPDTPDLQKRLIDSYAAAVPRYAGDILRGDFSIFPELARRVAERRERYNRGDVS